MLNQAELAQFTGTEHWYKMLTNPKVTYTDGAKYVAENAGAYWLLDEIATGQFRAKLRNEPFQVWKLTVNNDNSGVITIEDGNDNVLETRQFPFTDFPKEGITLWFTDNVILLPSEY